jgi:hypothetical protein
MQCAAAGRRESILWWGIALPRGREREPLDSARGPELVERASGFRLNCESRLNG